MSKLIKYICTSLFFLCISIPAIEAQMPFGRNAGNDSEQAAPITWTASARLTSPTDGILTITAHIADGWHLYGTSLPEGGPKPTTFTFSHVEGFEFTSALKATSPILSNRDPMFQLDLDFWEHTATFTRSFRISNPEAPLPTIRCGVSFMGCNDVTCLPQKRKEFNIKISKANNHLR